MRAALVAASMTAFPMALVAGSPQARPEESDAAERAVAYLAVETPRWRREHPCYSCHNNGDATRALVAASARGYAVGDALDDTLAWLASPERWDSNEPRGGSDDLPLARVQFASALASMVSVGRAPPAALARAASLVLSHQQEDGSWRLSESQPVGGATFYGTALATAMARRALARVSSDRVQPALARASAWLRSTGLATVLDASSVLLGLEGDGDSAAVVQREKALDIIRRGQGPDGGWGPYVSSRSEPFDSALALMALAEVRSVDSVSTAPFSAADLKEAIRRGRRYLVDMQSADGSWPETTRPPGGESYAQRISTTAWSLLALLESN